MNWKRYFRKRRHELAGIVRHGILRNKDHAITALVALGLEAHGAQSRAFQLTDDTIKQHSTRVLKLAKRLADGRLGPLLGWSSGRLRLDLNHQSYVVVEYDGVR